MNASSKSKFVKKAKRKEEWKPIGKVFTKIRYNWRPTRRTFTLVRNACPLNRITATNKLTLREFIPLQVVAQEYVVTKVFNRKPKVGISHETSVAQNPQQNGVVERRNRTLVEAARTMLIFAQALLSQWPRQLLLHVTPKTQPLYDDAMEKLFMSSCMTKHLIYPTIIKNLGKFQAKDDIGIFIRYAPNKKAYRIYNRRPRLQAITLATSSSGLIPNPIPKQPCNPPPRDDWDRLFQPMFDEYFNPLTVAISSVSVAAVPRAVDLANSPVSTSIDQDAPSTIIPSSQEQEYSPIISQGFEESPKTPHFCDDPLHESLYEDSTSQGSSFDVRPIYTPFESLGRWIKDHPIANVIGDPSRFDAFLT
nr:hypothetical protein [Tanacetum cinerariifolium]